MTQQLLIVCPSMDGHFSEFIEYIEEAAGSCEFKSNKIVMKSCKNAGIAKNAFFLKTLFVSFFNAKKVFLLDAETNFIIYFLFSIVSPKKVFAFHYKDHLFKSQLFLRRRASDALVFSCKRNIFKLCYFFGANLIYFESAKRFLPGKIKVNYLPDPVNLDAFHVKELVPEYNVGVFGSIIKEKNIEMLFKVFSNLSRGYHFPPKILIAGKIKPEYLDEISILISNYSKYISICVVDRWVESAEFLELMTRCQLIWLGYDTPNYSSGVLRKAAFVNRKIIYLSNSYLSQEVVDNNLGINIDSIRWPLKPDDYLPVEADIFLSSCSSFVFKKILSRFICSN